MQEKVILAFVYTANIQIEDGEENDQILNRDDCEMAPEEIILQLIGCN